MTFVVLAVLLAVMLGWIKHRRSLKDRRAGLDPRSPQHMVLADGEPTGPHHRWRGSRGDL